MISSRTTISNIYNDIATRTFSCNMEPSVATGCMWAIGWGARIVLKKDIIDLDEWISRVEVIAALKEGEKMVGGFECNHKELEQYEILCQDILCDNVTIHGKGTTHGHECARIGKQLGSRV